MKKVLAILLTLAFIASLAACAPAQEAAPPAAEPAAQPAAQAGSSEPAAAPNSRIAELTGVDTSEFVTIRCLFLGDQQADSQLVYDYINAGLKEWCNAEIEIEMIPWADWTVRYPLIFSAQEDYDLIAMSPNLGYYDYAPDNTLVEVNEEVLQTYMPLTWEAQDHNHFKLFDVAGKNYLVPVNFPANTFDYAVALRTDLLEKYGMEMPQTWEDLELFFDAVLENEEGMFPAAMSAADNGRDPSTYLYNEFYNMNEVNGLREFFVFPYTGGEISLDDIVLKVDDPNYLSSLQRIKTWADKGYWSQNANVNQTSNRDAFESGTSAALFQNTGTTALASVSVNDSGSGMQAEIVNLNPQTARSLGIPDGGMVVPAWSEKWERALMVLDYIKSDQDAYQAMRYGLKGTHWEPNEDGTRWIPLDQSGYVYGNGNSWQIKNEFLPFEMERINQLDSYIEMKTEWRESLLPVPSLFSFSFDTANVETEMANLNSVVSKYKLLLHFGLVTDVEATLAEYKDALEAAGIETVRAEMESQINAFLGA